MNRSIDRLASNVLQYSVSLLLVALVLIPLVMLFYGSVRTSSPGTPGNFTIQNYIAVLTNPSTGYLLLNTLTVALGSTLIATSVGTLLAWLTTRTNMPGARVFGILLIGSFFMPPFLGAIAWTWLASPNVGILNITFKSIFNVSPFNIYSPAGIMWVMGLYYSSYAFLLVSAALKSMDASLEESSSISGASIITTLRKITLPLMSPMIVASAVLVFSLSMENFSVPGVLGSPSRYYLLTTGIKYLVSSYPADYRSATVLSVILLLITVSLISIQKKIIGRKGYVTVTGKSHRPHLIDLKNKKYLAFAICLVYLFISFVLPVGSLVLVSLLKFLTFHPSSMVFTFNNYINLLGGAYPWALNALKNSFIVAGIGAILTVILTSFVAYVLVRTNIRGRKVISLVCSMPIAIPGMVLGMGMIWAWIRVPLPIYGTLWILIIAYLTRFMTIGLESTSAALTNMGEELEDCSRVCGASRLSTFARITLPLLKYSLTSTGLLLFIIFFRELSTAVLLYGSGTEVASVVIYDLYDSAAYHELVAAYGVIMLGIIFIIVTATNILGLKLGGTESSLY